MSNGLLNIIIALSAAAATSSIFVAVAIKKERVFKTLLYKALEKTSSKIIK